MEITIYEDELPITFDTLAGFVRRYVDVPSLRLQVSETDNHTLWLLTKRKDYLGRVHGFPLINGTRVTISYNDFDGNVPDWDQEIFDGARWVPVLPSFFESMKRRLLSEVYGQPTNDAARTNSKQPMGDLFEEKSWPLDRFDMPTLEGVLVSLDDLTCEYAGQAGALRQWQVRMKGWNIPLGFVTALPIGGKLVVKFYGMEWDKPQDPLPDFVDSDGAVWQSVRAPYGTWPGIMIDKIAKTIDALLTTRQATDAVDVPQTNGDGQDAEPPDPDEAGWDAVFGWFCTEGKRQHITLKELSPKIHKSYGYVRQKKSEYDGEHG